MDLELQNIPPTNFDSSIEIEWGIQGVRRNICAAQHYVTSCDDYNPS